MGIGFEETPYRFDGVSVRGYRFCTNPLSVCRGIGSGVSVLHKPPIGLMGYGLEGIGFELNPLSVCRGIGAEVSVLHEAPIGLTGYS